MTRFLFFSSSKNVWMTMILKRKKDQQRREKRKEWMSGIICTIYLFYTLSLNIIFLSVYLNFLWIKREREDVKNWNCPPIGENGALAMLPTHHGNHFLYNLTIWCQSNRQRSCLQEGETFCFRSNNQKFFCLKAELDSLWLRPFYYIFLFLKAKHHIVAC